MFAGGAGMGSSTGKDQRMTRGMFVLLLGVFALGPGSLSQAGKAARPLTSAEQKRFDKLVAQHVKTRARLALDYQTDLDSFGALVRNEVFLRTPTASVYGDAKRIVGKLVPGLSKAELGTLTVYVMDAIAARDPGLVKAANKTTQEMQISFNLQYLQLQEKMQNENRLFTAVSNVLMTRHDTVKNAINNVR
jgi:hypothetical protein